MIEERLADPIEDFKKARTRWFIDRQLPVMKVPDALYLPVEFSAAGSSCCAPRCRCNHRLRRGCDAANRQPLDM